MRVVFMGTPDAAVVTLDALVNSKNDVLSVVTSMDKPRGRGMKVAPTPVGHAAAEFGINTITIRSLKNDDVQSQLANLGAEAFVVTAFGFILPPAILSMPKYGCINVHFSLLPRWRGAAPVQRAIIEGDPITGVTIMKMDQGIDTGPIYLKKEVPISAEDTAGTLTDKLAAFGADLLVRTLSLIEEGGIEATPQEDSGATLAPKIEREEASVEWIKPAQLIFNEIRAFNPAPGAWGLWEGRRVKIWEAEIADGTGSPGEIIVSDEGLFVGTGNSLLRLAIVQPEGKARMSADEFVRGYRPMNGQVIS